MNTSTGGDDAGEENVFAGIIEFSKTIDVFRNSLFNPNMREKFSGLRGQAQHALLDLDAIPIEKRQSQENRAMYLYLRGKILDVSPVYNPEAENHLRKALELNENLVEAWLCLGTLCWKKGDLKETKSCYESGLKRDPKNSELLRQLSVIERRLCRGDIDVENREDIITDCIRHAKEAIALDIKDGTAWYALGNGSHTAFIMTGGWDRKLLTQSLKAYKNAAKDIRMQFSAELCNNFSTVYKYLENYEMALSGYQSAAAEDPSLNSLQQQVNLLEVFDKIDFLLKRLNDVKRLPSPTSSVPTVDSLASSLASVDLNPSYESVTVDSLIDGRNQRKAVIGNVQFSVENRGRLPLYYVVCDSDRTCFVITVYGLHKTAINEGDQVTLLDPFYHFFDFVWRGQRYQFKSVRVDNLKLLRVNGAVLSEEHVTHRSMYSQLTEA